MSHGGSNPEEAVLRKEQEDKEQTLIKEFIKTLKDEDKFFFKKFVLNKVEDLKGEAEKLGLSYTAISSKQDRLRKKFVKWGRNEIIRKI